MHDSKKGSLRRPAISLMIGIFITASIMLGLATTMEIMNKTDRSAAAQDDNHPSN